MRRTDPAPAVATRKSNLDREAGISTTGLRTPEYSAMNSMFTSVIAAAVVQVRQREPKFTAGSHHCLGGWNRKRDKFPLGLLSRVWCCLRHRDIRGNDYG